MLNRRIFFGAGATLVNRAVSVALGILLLPSLLHGLSKEEVGLWLLINQSWVAMSVLDFGLTTALQRRVGMVLASSGYLWDEERGSYPLQQVANAVHTVKRILSFVALATFFLCSIGGLFYLNAVAPDLAGWPTYAAWILLCASQALLLWSASTMSLLAGAGHIGWDSIIAAATSSFILVTQIVLVLAGGGILAMAVAAAIGALLQRCAIMRVAVWKQHDIHSLKGRYDADCIKSMLGPALRGWVTNLGYVVLTSVDQFMIASNSGLQELPGYRAATLLILNCYFLSGALSGASFAFYSQLWAADDKVAVRDLVERNTVVGIVGTTCSCTLIVVMGPGLFDAWLGTGNFVGTSVLVLVSSVYIIEIYANSFAHAARASGG
jgi:O-antigen/teichoic acid export membrane protein